MSKGGHRSKLASLRFCVNVATERRQHTQVEFVWITQRFRTIAVFPINWERLNAGVFTSILPATKRKSRTCATRETDVISERKHCSRKRRHTQVDFRTRRKCADKTQTIARKRWHGARKRKRSNVRSTCGRLKLQGLKLNCCVLTRRKNGSIETALSGHASAVLRVILTKETVCVAWLLYILSALAASRRLTKTHERNSDKHLPNFHAVPVLCP